MHALGGALLGALEEALEEALEGAGDKLVVLDFTATWYVCVWVDVYV